MNGGFDSLEEAVLCFYDSNNALQPEAQKWLTELQNSTRVWSAIWDELLPSKHTQLQFYGATLLHGKLLKDWSEIPVQEYDNLKSKLLEAVVYFRNGPKVVLNRLCISLAAFVLRTTAPYWPNAVSDLISLFQNAALFQNVPNVSTESLSWLLLEILSVIPEEFQTILLSKNEKIFVRNSLEGDSLSVLSFLQVALASSNLEIQLQALKCAKSWLEFGLPLEDCENLLNLLINIVSITYSDFETSRCGVNAIEAISILCSHPQIIKYPKTIVSYLNKILLLADILHSSRDIPNDDLIPCLYTLFVSFGDNHLKVLLETLNSENRDSFLKLLCIILQCSGAPGYYPKDEVYSIQTFNFWYSLQDEVLSINSDNNEIGNLIKPYYRKLILVLMQKSQYPNDMSSWSQEDKDAFRCYRQDIADTYAYCYTLLIHELMDIIADHLELAVVDPSIVTEWQKVESYLYAFHAISENVICSENPKVLRCILLLEKLPLSNLNVQVSQTVMELLGSYAEWLCSVPELLGPVLSLTFTGIENSHLAGPSTLALKDIVRECKTVLTPFAQIIVDKTTVLLERQHLNPTEESRLVFSFSTAVSLLPEETVIKCLDRVVTPYIKKVTDVLISPSENVDKTEAEITNSVKVFTQLFLGLSVQPPKPEFCLLRELLPILKVILERYKGQVVVSSTCIAIKCAVSNLGDACCDLVPLIVDIVITTYNYNAECSILDLAKQLLLLFGNNSNCSELMSLMLKNICEITLAIFKNTTPENVSDHTSTFEHFYSFCTNVLKKNCKLLLSTEGIEHAALFRYAGFALCAQEVSTVKSAASFLCNVITVSREQDALLSVVQMYGAELVQLIMIAIGKVSPRNCLEHVADVLVALSKKYCDWLSRWLNEIMAPEGFPSTRATAAAKKRFIKSILREKANKRRVQDTTKEFSFLCRGLLNKEYVEQTTSDV